MKINLTNKNTKPINQQFSFYTEEGWKKENQHFNKHVDLQFSGKKDETFVLIKGDAVHYLIGLGNDPKDNELQQTAAKFSYQFRKKIQAEPTSVEVFNSNKRQKEEIIKGLYLGTYEYPFKEEHPLWNAATNIVISEMSVENLEQIQLKTLALCKGQFACMEWLNKPQNFKKTAQISAFLKETAKRYSFKISIYNRQQCEELGLGAFVAVNQGSSQEAAFTVIEYQCGLKNAKTAGLVGKCVLFDTGGISIKGAENLHYMKSDMGGATAVIGTLITAAELKLPVNVVAVLPITDNAVSNDAYTPSDVVTAYNGKTIEVLNTDAEGRMTLADGLSYLAQNYKTDVLIDLATLTGSAVRMFGYTCGAYFSNNDDLKKSLETAANQTGQRLWNLPLWDVWKDDFMSDVADFKNISSKPFGDCIVAGKFLEQFIGDHHNWAHLDIAGVAFGNVLYMKEKGATGYGVQLLVDFLENF